MRPRSPAWIGLFTVTAACRGEREVYLSRVWPEGSEVLIVLVDGGGSPIEPAPRYLAPGAALSIPIDRGAAVRVIAHVFEPGSGIDGGEVFGGDGVRLPAVPNYTATVGEEDEPSVFEMTGLANDYDLRRAPGVVRDCRDVSTRRLPAAGYEELGPIVVTSGRVFVGGATPGRQAAILELTGDRLSTWFTLPPDTTNVSGLGWDGAAIWATAFEGRVFALDLAGQVRLAGAARTWITRLSIGRDGTKIARGAILASGEDYMYELTEDATVAASRVELVREDYRTHAVAGRDEVYVAGSDALWRWNGVSLLNETTVDSAEYGTIIAEPGRAVAFPRYAGVLLRQPDGRWERTPRPVDGFVRTAAFLPGGRLIVGGERDAAAIYTGTEWCRIRPPVLEHLEHLAAAPDGRTVWASTGVGEGAALLRFDLPDDP